MLPVIGTYAIADPANDIDNAMRTNVGVGGRLKAANPKKRYQLSKKRDGDG